MSWGSIRNVIDLHFVLVARVERGEAASDEHKYHNLHISFK